MLLQPKDVGRRVRHQDGSVITITGYDQFNHFYNGRNEATGKEAPISQIAIVEYVEEEPSVQPSTGGHKSA